MLFHTYAEKDWRAKYNSKRLVPVVKLSLIKSVSLSAPVSSKKMTCFSPADAFSTTLLINVVSCKNIFIEVIIPVLLCYI